MSEHNGVKNSADKEGLYAEKIIAKESYNEGEQYSEKHSLVMGVKYGKQGIIPCHMNSKCYCVSSSGEITCGGYLGSEEVVVGGCTMHVVKCVNDIECISNTCPF